MSSDPAEDAARRVAERWAGLSFDIDDLEAGAEEALKPLRKLHRKRRAGSETYCAECCHIVGSGYELTYQSWPCATAKLIYPKGKLT